MTDTNELRRVLDELADETPEVPAQEWLAGTRHKVRVRRQARWAGTTAATALVLAAAVAVVPQVMEDAGPQPAPVEPSPGEPREWEFVDGTQVHRIVATRLNEPGESEFEWTLSIKGSPQRIEAGMQFCHLPADAGESDIRLVSSVDGRRMTTSRCRHWGFYPPVAGQMVSQVQGALEDRGIDRTEPFTVLMWLERDGERIEVPGVVFGYGFFWETYPQRGGIGGSSLGIPWRDSDGELIDGPLSGYHDPRSPRMPRK